MKRKFTIHLLVGWSLLMLLAASGQAGPIKLVFHDTTITGGKQFDYPVYVDTSLSASNITAYEIEFTYRTSVLTFVGVVSDSTLTSSWGAPAFNQIAPGRIRVASGGTTALIGQGKLVILRFVGAAFQYWQNANVNFERSLLNEGTPSTAQRNGWIQVSPAPFITINPDNWRMTKGETKQFTVSGGKAPYVWSSTNPAVASITSGGMATASQPGFARVVCVDSNGTVDTSGPGEVRALMLSIRDTSGIQGQYLDLPVTTSSVTGLGIVSAQFSLTYDQNYWTPEQVLTAGTLLQSAPTDYALSANKITITFASSAPLTGSGTLLRIRMKASMVRYGSIFFDFVDAPLFNESLPANYNGAYVAVNPLVPLTVSPGEDKTILAGDSLQFTSSGGTLPYTWTTSDTAHASISSAGWLKGKASGDVIAKVQDAIGATGQSGTISVYDFRLSIPDTSFLPASTIDVPVYVTPNAKGFESFAMRVNYPIGTNVQCTAVISAGTLSEGFSLASYQSAGSVKIAAAIGSGKISAGGVLLKLRFSVADTMVIPPRTTLTLSEVLFNEGSPLSLNDDGYFDITNRSVFNITPLSASFVVPAVGKKDSAMFVIRNSGTAILTSSLSIDWPRSMEFTVLPMEISVPPADSVKIKVFYQPMNLGTDTTFLRFFTNDPIHSNIALQLVGKVLLTTVISFDISTFAFGSVEVTKKRDTLVTISNPGTDTLKITAITASDAAFSARPAAVKIPPGQSFVDTLRFAPALVAAIPGRFLIVSNAATSPDTIRFSGTGTPAMGVDRMGGIPGQFTLEQNFPNPFNPSTTIWYSVPTICRVKIQICDVLGQVVVDLVDSEQSPGWRSVVWNAQAASGMYFYRIEATSTDEPNKRFVQVKRMILMK